MDTGGARWALIVALSFFSATANSQTAPRQVSSKLEKGYRLLRENKRTEALAAFNHVIQSDPSNHAALVELGYLQSGFKRWKSAVKYLKAASAQEPGNPRLHMDLGYVYEALKDHENAANEFALVAKEPGDFQNQARTALAAVQNGRQSAQASAEAKRARVVEQGYAALKKGNKALARERFEAALKQEPRNTTVLKQLAFMDLSQGKLSAAVQRLETARSADPNDHFASLQLGYLYQRQRRPQQAEEAFRDALASSDPQIRGSAQAALNAAAPSAEGAKTEAPGQEPRLPLPSRELVKPVPQP